MEARTTQADMRLLSLDVYRGLIMISLAFNGFGLQQTAKNKLAGTPDSVWWQSVQYQFSHVEWVGCAFWDLIQPSFMFMVGVSMAYSYVKRRTNGESWSSMLRHALTRALILCMLGIFLISNNAPSTEWSLMNVLTQIGLGYPFLFMLWGRSRWLQGIVAILLLAGTWLLYTTAAGSGIERAHGNSALGVTADWARQHLSGVPTAWHKGANVGNTIDLWLLNWFPRNKPFEFSSGGYQTINFIPSLATMIFGLMCGELLRANKSSVWKMATIFIAGALGIGLGWWCQSLGCPIIKRLWTPSWALFSTGICCLILGMLYGVIDVAGFRSWTFPVMVVGANSIAVYVMSMLLKPWTATALKTHLGQDLFELFGTDYEPLLRYNLVGLCFWFACYWLYRNKVFIRI